jgi:site-specific DNA-methyltransferase (adenine-specific)
MITIGKATLHNVDCMEYMKSLPDNAFDLAIVDPPYGIDINSSGRLGHYGGKDKKWDSETPKQEYFNELMRVSKNQIIWGGNYFPLPLTGGWIFWDKERGKETTFSDGELAWTNFMNTLKKVSVRYDGFIGMDLERIHPTQKPVKLYEKILTNYAKQGDKILDTHLGSGSHAIACNNLGFELTACELDKDYYVASIKRIQQATAQERLF